MSEPWVIAFCVLALVVVVEGLVLVGVATRFGALLRRTEALLSAVTLDDMFRGLPVGSRAPVLDGIHEHDVVSATGGEDPELLLFLDTDCGPCLELAEELNATDPELPARTVAIVHRRRPDDPLPLLPKRWIVVEQSGHEISEAFQVKAAPYAYLIDAQGMVAASGVTSTIAHLDRLVSRAATLPAAALRIPLSSAPRS